MSPSLCHFFSSLPFSRSHYVCNSLMTMLQRTQHIVGKVCKHLKFCYCCFSVIPFFFLVSSVQKLRDGKGEQKRERDQATNNTYFVNRYNIQLKTCHMHWIVTVIWNPVGNWGKIVCSLCGECVCVCIWRQPMKIICEEREWDRGKKREHKVGENLKFKAGVYAVHKLWLWLHNTHTHTQKWQKDPKITHLNYACIEIDKNLNCKPQRM